MIIGKHRYRQLELAQCLSLPSLPNMQRASDAECEGRVVKGFRLGSKDRLAVYARDTYVQGNASLPNQLICKRNDAKVCNCPSGVAKFGARCVQPY